MDREEALKLLHGGREGVAEWNRRRLTGDIWDDLSGVALNAADLCGIDLSPPLVFAEDPKSDIRVPIGLRPRLCGASLKRADLTNSILILQR